ncbi:predicted fimbrial protein [Escherichia albertii]|uniref:fimbrial protein n=1 Tax=Escherichia albertii TaxID=208962 RepID=UPI00071F7A1D|nr:fimbrial protein [Escherichia albertii]EEU9600240.1 fimbrial protein [Escherichia albertii]MCZ8775601.1 fimbrial protein [Escherichia albertii]QTA08460.1 fimbrial protein [Escherichia albertii]WDC02290.1 fimbrial protein [Escherichia albertii]BAT36929.1 predicted fimbrial protein [Escherichia albertii]
MKKLMIASAIAMSFFGGSAVASQGDIQFFGNVTEVTCDVTPEVDGNVTDLVQLGTVKKGETGKEIDLVFKATSPAGDECSSLSSGNTASVAWMGNLTADGIGAQGGLASDAYVILKPANGQADDAITSANYVATFDAEKVTNGDGLQFKAQLKGGSIPGDFRSAAAYAVTYQ